MSKNSLIHFSLACLWFSLDLCLLHLRSGTAVRSLPAPTPAFVLTEMSEHRGRNRSGKYHPSFICFWRVFVYALTWTVSLISFTVALAQLCHKGRNKHLEISSTVFATGENIPLDFLVIEVFCFS